MNSVNKSRFEIRPILSNILPKNDIQCESGFIESPPSEINFLISLAWAKGGIDVGNPMLEIEKCCEGDRAPPTPQKSENKFPVICLSMRKDSHCKLIRFPKKGGLFSNLKQNECDHNFDVSIDH